MGKDVVSFLSWAAEPEMEERKLVSYCNLSAELSSVLIAKCNFWLPSVTCASNCIFISWFCIRWESNGFSCSHSLFCKLDITGAWSGLSSSLASWSLMWLTEAWCLISSTILSIIWNVWNNPYMIYALQLAWYPCLKCRFLGYHYPYLRGCCFRFLPGTSKHIIECMYT